MKRFFYSAITIALVSATVFLDGCKKSNPVDGHIQSLTVNGVTSNFTYDSQGRILTYSSGGNTLQFNYSSSSVTVSYNGNITIWPLNNQGYVSSDGNGNYSYDNNGYLIAYAPAGGTSTGYSYTNGNLTSVTSGATVTDSYTYTTTRDYRNYGTSVLGKNGESLINFTLFPQSVNLVNQDNINGTILQYNYTYDSKGRVSTQTINGGAGSTTTQYYYTTN